MLTLKQINEVSFRKSNFSGYRPEDVDEFIDEVSASFTTLLKEHHAYKQKATDLLAKNNELKEKLQVLAYKVEEYKEDENGIKDILLSAQKVSNASIKEAKDKAEQILSEANQKADTAMDEAKKKTVDLIKNYEFKIAEKQRELDAIKAEVSAFRANLYEMYRNHISSVEAIPDYSAELEQREADNAQKAAEEKKLQEETERAIQEKMAQEENFSNQVEEIEDFDNFIPDIDLSSTTEFETTDISSSSSDDKFHTIDFDTVTSGVQKERESLYSSLEFGDEINLKK